MRMYNESEKGEKDDEKAICPTHSILLVNVTQKRKRRKRRLPSVMKLTNAKSKITLQEECLYFGDSRGTCITVTSQILVT